MTVDALPIASPARQASAAGGLFSVALILTTVLPFAAIAYASFHPFAIPAVVFLATLGSTHVFATGYLLTDRSVRRFALDHPIKMIGVPLLMLTAGTVVFSMPGSQFFVVLVLAYFVYQAWHFGSQNIGVATFVSLADRGRALSSLEKRAIRIGVVVGMLGVLKAMAPDYLIGAQHMPLLFPIPMVIDFFYRIGCGAAPLVVLAALWLALRGWRERNLLHAMAIFLGPTFLFPMYLTGDIALGYLSFATAHGLQYLVFLASHSLAAPSDERAKARPWLAVLLAPAALIAILLSARLIWNHAPALQTTSLPLFGMGVVFSLTLTHFWVDRYLWRMSDKSRAAWARARFAFIFNR